MAKLRIDIWSDIACPWCYIGKRRIEAALARFSHAKDVEIVWRSFELDPSTPPVLDSAAYAERLGKKFGGGPERAQAMLAQMTTRAAEDGLEFRFDRIQAGNTFTAHRLLHLAHERGVQDALKERLFRAYFTDGLAIGDPEALKTIGVAAGLDAAEVTDVLATDRFATEVRADQALARELGISGVPFFVLAGRLGVSGAQSPEVLLSALDKAWSELAVSPPLPVFAEGAACGPDGCD